MKKKKMMTPNMWRLWSLCVIPILLVFVFNYIPMFGIIIAFKDYKFAKGIFGSEWCGFDNFKYLVKSDTFSRIVRNTLVMNFIFIVVSTIAACGLAVMLFRLINKRNKKIYQTILITPHFLSWVVVSYMAYALLSPVNGIITQVISLFTGERIDFYQMPGAWPVILTICTIWKSVGMDSVIYYAALTGMDHSLIEAAEIDGATKWQVNRYILLPYLTSLICIQTILKVGGIFRADFGLFYQIPRNVAKLYKTTDVIDTYIFRTMQRQGAMDVSTATGLLQSIVGAVLVITVNWIVKKINDDNALF